MAVARFASAKPIAGVDTLLYTVARTALTSIVAVNLSGLTKISAWIVPAGEELNEDAWIYYINNIELTNRNTFETFKIAVNAGDKIYASSLSGEVTFFINGIFDLTGTTNITVGAQEPESPQIGDIWINSEADPQEVFYWEGAFWQATGIQGPPNILSIGTVEAGEFGDPAEVTITGDSPEQVLNFVLPMGEQGPPNELTLGTVTTGNPGTSADVEITGTSPDQTINFTIPRGDTGPANTLTVGTVNDTLPGEAPEVTITGTAPDQTIDFVLPRGDTGPSNTLTVGTVSASNPGEQPIVEITGASPDQTINFTLPRGEVGPTGPTGPLDLPSYTGNEGKFLTTDGTDAFWENVDALPPQDGNSGKYLTTDGTDPSWAFLSGGSAGAEPPTTGLVDGSIWLDTDGEIQPASVEIRRWTKVVSSPTTEFTGLGSESVNLDYNPGTEQVYLNGVALIRGSDYTASSGSSIILATEAVSGDILQVILLPPVEISNAVLNTIFDAKGDILTASADNTPAKLSVGANGTFLKADSSEPTGMVWDTVDALPSQTGQSGNYLTTDGSVASWSPVEEPDYASDQAILAGQIFG